VRTVSSNFGFAFGPSPARTSSEATPTREIEAPLAKRRKTILSKEIVTAEHIEEKHVSAPKSTKAVKSKRRLPVDNFEDKAQPDSVAADDSFLAVVERKKGFNAKTKARKTNVAANEAPMEFVKVQSAARGRPNGLSATTAASRVTEGFEEETAPIDRKRRDAKRMQKRFKSRKKDVSPAEEERVRVVSIEQGYDFATDLKRPLPKMQTAGRKRKAAALDIVEEKDELVASVAARGKGDAASERNDTPVQALASKSAPKPRNTKGLRIGRKQRQNGKDSTVWTQHSRDDFTHSVQQLPVEVVIPPTPPRRTRKPSRRQPLAEADRNITIRSSSPGKVPQGGPKLAIKPVPKSSRPCKGLPSPEKITRPANKRRKLDVQRDAGGDRSKPPATISQSKSPVDPVALDNQDLKQSLLDRAPRSVAVSGSANQSWSAATAAKRRSNLNKPENVERIGAKKDPDKQTSTAQTQEEEAGRAPRSELGGNDVETISLPNAKTSTSAPVAHSNNPPEGNEEAAASRPGDAEDEDVDWLFAPQPQASTALKPSAKVQRANASSKCKMPEIDLDDLLSNIATFAQAKTSAGPPVAHNGLFNNREPGKGRGRKKAKV
jgi:hypothetical protein